MMFGFNQLDDAGNETTRWDKVPQFTGNNVIRNDPSKNNKTIPGAQPANDQSPVFGDDVFRNIQ